MKDGFGVLNRLASTFDKRTKSHTVDIVGVLAINGRCHWKKIFAFVRAWLISRKLKGSSIGTGGLSRTRMLQ